jgi:hypothetical protein
MALTQYAPLPITARPARTGKPTATLTNNKRQA